MILDDITAYRKIQLEREMSEHSPAEVKKAAEAISAPCRGFAKALKKDSIAVIAEVKKASPSKGLICPDFRPAETAVEYEKAGAAAVSCLTEEHYFMGCSAYLTAVHEKISLPVLRKDFIIDPYQIYEARTIGADAVLLIAALLDKDTLKEYNDIAASLGLDTLAEAHNERELDNILEAGCRTVGINNRDLTTFNVTLDTTEKLAGMIPQGYTIVSESGIKTNEDIRRVRACGADAVLIGETLMRSGDIAGCMNTLTQI